MLLSSGNWYFHIILAIPVFLVCYWILNNVNKVRRFKLAVASLATIVITPFLYSALIHLFFLMLFGKEVKRDFNQQSWLNEPSIRYQMADDIVDEKILLGKDSFQVKELLGTGFHRYPTIQSWQYDMGTGGGGLGFKFHYLRLRFSGAQVDKVDYWSVVD